MLTPIKAMRAKCLDCCCWHTKEVRLCTKGPDAKMPCALYPYRMGTNPNIKKRILTQVEKDACTARLRKANP